MPISQNNAEQSTKRCILRAVRSAALAKMHLRININDASKCCMTAQQAWCRDNSKAMLTLLRLQYYCGVDAVSKHTSSGLTVVGCHRESEVNRAQTKRVGRRVNDSSQD